MTASSSAAVPQQQSAARLRPGETAGDRALAILEAMSEGFIAFDSDGRCTAMNDAAESFTCQTRATSVGQMSQMLFPASADRQLMEHLRRAQSGRLPFEFEWCETVSGRWLATRLCPMADGGTVVFLRDVTEASRAGLHLAFLASMSRELADFCREEDMMRTVGARIGAHLQLSHCAFAEIDEAADRATITHDWHRTDVPGLVGSYRISDMLGEGFIQATHDELAFVVDDTQTDSRAVAARYAAIGIGAFLSVPLIRSDRCRFLLAACHSAPHRWRDDEIGLMRDVTDRIWTRLERLRAEAQVKASEQRYRMLVNAMDEGFCIAEVLFDEMGRAVDHRILEANPAFERHTGVTHPVGKKASELVPGGEQVFNDRYGQVVTSGESVRFESGSDVMQRWFDVFVTRAGDAASRQVAIFFKDISERKRAETSIRQRTEQFETLLNAAPLGVYLIDAGFRVRAVNPAALPTFAGIPDVIGRDFAEVLHILWPEKRAAEFVQRFRQTLASGEPFASPDDSVVREDIGETRYYAWQINRIALPEGGYGVVCYFRDIAAQVLARAAVAESEQRYRTLFAAAPMALFACDRDAVIQQYNARAAELWGRSPVCGVEQHCGSLKLWLPDGSLLPHAHSPIMEVLRTGIPVHNVEVFIERPDGSRLPVLANFAALKDAIGDITGSVTSFIDISDRVRADRLLREGEQRLRFVMDSMPQKIFTTTPTGEIDYLNAQWSEFTGVSAEQLRDWSQTGLIHPDDLMETHRIWQQGFSTGQPLQIENRLRGADGAYRWHLNRLRPLHDLTGQRDQIVMWIGSSTDIDEQKQAAAELRKLADALAEADRRKSNFLAMLAHELRNPLAPLRNALQILRLGPTEPGTVAAMSGIMDRQVSQMVRLVDDLLDVSRITQDKIELRKVRVSLAAVVNLAVEASLAALEGGQHQLTVTLPPEPVFLLADPARLTQVFSNLLNNATKYGTPGGAIALRAVRVGREVRVSVKDTGIGIPTDMLAKIFDLFTQVDQTLERTLGGLGIGLTLVQNLVEMHGGTVTAVSEGSGRGSEFVVRLPVLVETAAEPLDDRAGLTPSAGARRILVVDDNRDSAQTLQQLLDLLGHETRIAFDGLEALDTAAAFRPDLVLLDIGMPRLNGYEAARRLRAEPWGRSMVLVALTGWGQDEDRRKTTEAGFDRHLVKPVDFEALMQILQDTMPVTSVE